jgi:hypothetical protein
VARALEALQSASPEQLVLRLEDPQSGAELAPA